MLISLVSETKSTIFFKLGGHFCHTGTHHSMARHTLWLGWKGKDGNIKALVLLRAFYFTGLWDKQDQGFSTRIPCTASTTSCLTRSDPAHQVIHALLGRFRDAWRWKTLHHGRRNHYSKLLYTPFPLKLFSLHCTRTGHPLPCSGHFHTHFISRLKNSRVN